MRGNKFIASEIADPLIICADLYKCSVADLGNNSNGVLNEVSAKRWFIT